MEGSVQHDYTVITEKVKKSVHERAKLTVEEIKDAGKLVEQKHPLQDIPIWKTLPFLKSLKGFFPEWVPKTQKAESEDLKKMQTQRKLMSIASGSAIAAY